MSHENFFGLCEQFVLDMKAVLVQACCSIRLDMKMNKWVVYVIYSLGKFWLQSLFSV